MDIAPASLPLIIDKDETAKRLNISPRSLARMRTDGSGPPYVQLSPRRIGYSVPALESWVASKLTTSTRKQIR